MTSSYDMATKAEVRDPEVDDDPYTVAAEVLHAIKEREHEL